MTASTEKRAKIIARIKALRAMTKSAGASEAEANMAAEQAAKLMAEYQIGQSDIAASEYDKFVLPLKGVKLSARASHPFVMAANGVGHVSGCDAYLSSDGMIVVGDDVGREIAGYLFDLVRNALEASWKIERRIRELKQNALIQKVGIQVSDWLRKSKRMQSEFRGAGCATDNIAKRSYQIGMALRMAARMLDMAPARKIPEDVSKRLVGGTIVEKRKSKKPLFGDASAFRTGIAAGDGVGIGLGVAGTKGGVYAIQDQSGGE